MGSGYEESDFQGSGEAIITPMKENGEIKLSGVQKLLDRQAVRRGGCVWW